MPAERERDGLIAAALSYNWRAQRGVLELAANMDAPPMDAVCTLFEGIDPRCTCVIVVDPAGAVLASFERFVARWDPRGAAH
jgi:hypothetical protein